MPGFYYYNMPGQIRMYPISEEEANKIRKQNKFLYRAGASGIGLGVLAYATESLIRNLGGVEYEGLAKQFFEVANYLSLGGLVVLGAPFFGGGHVISPKDSSKKESLEEKAT